MSTLKKNVPEIIKVDLTHFPTDERFAQIRGKLVLADNLDNVTFSQEGHPDFPVQITMMVAFICMSGQMEMKIDMTDYTLNSGDAVTILPGRFFQIKRISDDARCLFMAMSPDFISYVGDVKLGIALGRKLQEMPIYHPTPLEMDDLVSIYKSLKGKLLNPEYRFKEEVARSYLRIMQCNIFQTFIGETQEQPDQRPINRKEELFLNFLAVVKECYSQSRSITFYADKLFVSPKYLSSVVHEVSGTYATDWINQHVILEAKALLREKNTSIKYVSNKLNFANQSFFAKYFKQHTGYTPKEYKAL